MICWISRLELSLHLVSVSPSPYSIPNLEDHRALLEKRASYPIWGTWICQPSLPSNNTLKIDFSFNLCICVYVHVCCVCAQWHQIPWSWSYIQL